MILRPGLIVSGISLVFVSFLLSVSGCKGITAKTQKGVYHTVQRGETLWRICYTYRVNMETVCRTNEIKNPDRIEVGQRVFLPGVTELKVVPPLGEEPTYPSALTPPEGAGFIWPVKGMVTTWYGVTNGKRHDGIDIVVPKGTPIQAAKGGKVLYSDKGISGYGNVIIIEHPEGINSVYAHNNKNYVQVEDVVKKGQVIGEVGDTGRSSGAHLHFEVRRGSVPVDPMMYLP